MRVVEEWENAFVDNCLNVRLLQKSPENRVFTTKHPLADFDGLLSSAFVVIIGKRRPLATWGGCKKKGGIFLPNSEAFPKKIATFAYCNQS